MIQTWLDSKDAVFFVGFVLGALCLALLTSLFRGLKPDGVRALKRSEIAVLAAIHHIGGSGYVSTLHIWDEVRPAFSIGTVFAAIERLEAGGYVYSTQVPGGDERGGRNQLLVRLTLNGERFQSANAGKPQGPADSRVERQRLKQP